MLAAPGRGALIDGPVVSRIDERREACRVHQAVAHRIRVEAHAQQLAEERGYRHSSAGCRIETRQFAAGIESREPAFESVGVRDDGRNGTLVGTARDDLASCPAERGEHVTGDVIAGHAHET